METKELTAAGKRSEPGPALSAHERDRARLLTVLRANGQLKYADPQLRREMRTFAREGAGLLNGVSLGLTVALLLVPAAAQAQWNVPEGVHGHANNRGVGSYTEYVPFVTDFPKYELNTAKVVGIGGPGMHVIGTSEPSVSSTKIVSSRGFDWGDAAIGATLALGLALLAGSAVRVSRHFGKPQTA